MMSMPSNFTTKIIISLILGILVGISLKFIPMNEHFRNLIIDDTLNTIGKLFINLLRMLVVPVVFVSLVCGISSLKNIKMLGRIGFKTLFIYMLTTVIALSFGIFFADIFNIGSGATLKVSSDFISVAPPPLKEVILNLIPSNPVHAMANGDMLQLIIFSVFLGMAITLSGKNGEACRNLFIQFNEVLMKLVYLVMILAPYGIFCLLSSLFARQGLDVLLELMQYLLVITFTLLFHLIFTYSLFLRFAAKLNPIHFFKKMYNAMLFAFGVSSSNASIPIVLETVEERLGVKNSIASFVVPLGASINMNGTAIMQSVATVFIANVYHIDIGLTGYLTVIFMATLASIGTAGVPGIGVLTLTMVLQQVGLPVEGTALIISVDRIVDMLRTSVNVAGDAMASCMVAHSEGLIDRETYAKDC